MPKDDIIPPITNFEYDKLIEELDQYLMKEYWSPEAHKAAEHFIDAYREGRIYIQPKQG